MGCACIGNSLWWKITRSLFTIFVVLNVTLHFWHSQNLFSDEKWSIYDTQTGFLYHSMTNWRGVGLRHTSECCDVSLWSTVRFMHGYNQDVHIQSRTVQIDKYRHCRLQILKCICWFSWLQPTFRAEILFLGRTLYILCPHIRAYNRLAYKYCKVLIVYDSCH
jgi:hypothetical protein